MVDYKDIYTELHAKFEYRDGAMYWKINGPGIRGGAGSRAGWISVGNDYRQMKVGGKHHLEHRMIYLYHHGVLPEYVDHIDQNSINNDISNLREATKAQNCSNRGKNVTNTSGYKGVSIQDGYWRAMIGHNNKLIYLGRFESAIAAAKAYDVAAREYHGEFAYQNFSD